PCSTDTVSPRRPAIASVRFTTGSVPLMKSRELTAAASTYAPNGVGGAGNAMPRSRRPELGLPLGARMRASGAPDAHPVPHWCRLQVEQRVHDFRDLHQPRNGVQLLQGLVVVAGVHRRVDDAG